MVLWTGGHLAHRARLLAGPVGPTQIRWLEQMENLSLFRPVVGWPDYWVSHRGGLVFSTKPQRSTFVPSDGAERSPAVRLQLRHVAQQPHRRTGHLRVWLYPPPGTLGPDGEKAERKGRGVHQLVCRAWNGPPGEGDVCVRHRDHCPSNNDADNLLWGSLYDNAQDERHRRRSETLAHMRGEGQTCLFGVSDYDDQDQVYTPDPELGF